jgi:hypothetical protein
MTAGALLVLFNGCTAIGYLMGTDLDRYDPELRHEKRQPVKQLKPNSPIKLILANNDTLACTYTGRTNLSLKEYSARFQQHFQRFPKNTAFALPGEEIVIMNRDGLPMRGVLKMYDYDSVMVNFRGGTGSRSWPLKSMTSVEDSDGNKLSVKELRKLMNEGEIPVSSVLEVMTSTGPKQFAYGEAKEIRVYKKPVKGRIIGTMIGFAIDAYIIYKISQAPFGMNMAP